MILCLLTASLYTDPSSPGSDLLSSLDHEDPVARALFKMVEFNDKVASTNAILTTPLLLSDQSDHRTLPVCSADWVGQL